MAKGPWFLVCCWGSDGQLLVWHPEDGWLTQLPNERALNVLRGRPKSIPAGAWVVEIAPPPWEVEPPRSTDADETSQP